MGQKLLASALEPCLPLEHLHPLIMSTSSTPEPPYPAGGPHTPLREANSLERTPTSDDTLAEKGSHLSLDAPSHADAGPAAQPFLACARRVRSFTSPMKNDKARYFLSFSSERVAQEWWQLMQREYPDARKDSRQMYSFKSERVPARAWDNPAFAHLKDKWTYRIVEDNSALQTPAPEKNANLPKKPGKRVSLMRMLSTPSLGSIGEDRSTRIRNDVSQEAHDDPFIGASRPSFDPAELNATLDRMLMMMNQTQLRIDVLTERQQAHVKSMERLQTALEANTVQIQALTSNLQVEAASGKNLRAALDTNAGHVRTILERHAHDDVRHARVEASLQRLDTRLDGMLLTQAASHSAARDTMDGLSDKLQKVLETQSHTGLGISAELLSSLDTRIDSPMVAQQVDQVGLSDLQAVIQDQAQQIAALADSLTTATSQHSQEMLQLRDLQQSHFEKQSQQIEASQDKTAATGTEKHVHFAEPEEDVWKERLEDLKESHEQHMADMQQAMFGVMTEQLSQMQAAHKVDMDLLMAAITNKGNGNNQPVIKCNHNVAPPPRKMNREMIGYWYK